MVRIQAHRLRSFRPCRWQFVGRRVSTVNALGDEAQTAYDANGNVVSEEGATYPVRYAYGLRGSALNGGVCVVGLCEEGAFGR